MRNTTFTLTRAQRAALRRLCRDTAARLAAALTREVQRLRRLQRAQGGR